MACSVIGTVVSLSGGRFRVGSADASFIQRGNASTASVCTRSRNYSLSASPDKNLLDAIQSEIDCKSNNQLFEALVAETPKDFPFKIEDTPWEDYLTFVREHNGETIEVEARPAGDKDERSRLKSESLEIIKVTVMVRKKNGAELLFDCTASPPDEFTVDRVCMHYPEEEFDMYDGSYVISEFNEKLQKGLYEYLENRGINLTTTNVFCNYLATYLVTTRDDRQDASWLKAFKNFFLL